MYVSAIQNQLTNSTKGMHAKNMPYSICTTNDLTADSFSTQKTNNVSFAGAQGALKGGAKGIIGGLALAGTLAAFGCVVAPFVATYVICGGAIGASIGSDKDDSKKDDEK